jgi:hypothetical protein
MGNAHIRGCLKEIRKTNKVRNRSPRRGKARSSTFVPRKGMMG